MVVLAEQYFARVLVDYQGGVRLKIERVFSAIETGHLAER